MSKARTRKIKLIRSDVGSVLTDGKIWIFPAPGRGATNHTGARSKTSGRRRRPVESNDDRSKAFNAHDDTAFSMLRRGDVKTGLITKRISDALALHARDLKIVYVHQGIQDKLTCFAGILKQQNLKASEAAFVGDDVIDLPVMRACGLAIAVADARREVV